jgi:septal ring factor EnvC (AmiA/AmiB activator)
MADFFTIVILFLVFGTLFRQHLSSSQFLKLTLSLVIESFIRNRNHREVVRRLETQDKVLERIEERTKRNEEHIERIEEHIERIEERIERIEEHIERIGEHIERNGQQHKFCDPPLFFSSSNFIPSDLLLLYN